MSFRRTFLLLTLLLLLPLSVAAKDFVVVIDPGHGGKDAGALGQRTNEKTINLGVATRLRDLINANMKDASVVMTRDNDRFVTLQGRADLANKKHADIFISIHANSVDRKSPMFTKVNGASVYTLGLKRSDTNLSVAMRENAVMKLEPDYSTTYQGFDPSSAESYIAFEMMQHSNLDQSIELAEAVQNQLVRTAGRKNNGVRQAPFWVLVRTSMPAILVELDFICNPAMEKYMASESGQKRLAQAIYNGIAKYRKSAPLKADKSTAEPTSSDIREAEQRFADDKAEEAAEKSSRTDSDKASRTSKSDKERKNDKERKSEKAPQADSGKSADGKTVFKIQFMTAPKPLPAKDRRFKGLSPVDYYKDGGMVKYTFGSFSSQAEASKTLREVRRNFPDAFVIKMRDGKRIK